MTSSLELRSRSCPHLLSKGQSLSLQETDEVRRSSATFGMAQLSSRRIDAFIDFVVSRSANQSLDGGSSSSSPRPSPPPPRSAAAAARFSAAWRCLYCWSTPAHGGARRACQCKWSKIVSCLRRRAQTFVSATTLERSPHRTALSSVCFPLF